MHHFRNFLSLLFCLLIWTPVIAQDESSPNPPAASEQKPAQSDETSLKIISLHLKARGGLESLQKLQDLRIEGELVEGPKDYQLVLTRSAPDRLHQEATRQHLGDDYVTVTVTDGETAWEQSTQPKRKNPRKLEGLSGNLVHLDAMIPFLFLELESNGHIFKYRGKERFAKRDVYVLHGWLNNGFELDILLDTQSFHIINYRHHYTIGGKKLLIDRAPAGLARVQDTWWEKGYVFRLRGKAFRRITFDAFESVPAPDGDTFVMPPVHERWLRSNR